MKAESLQLPRFMPYRSNSKIMMAKTLGPMPSLTFNVDAEPFKLKQREQLSNQNRSRMLKSHRKKYIDIQEKIKTVASFHSSQPPLEQKMSTDDTSDFKHVT